MAFIVSHQELARHPKVKRAARMLGVSIPAMIGHLHLLWWWALDYGGEDGDLSRYDAADLAEAALWDGDPDVFVRALVECGPGGGAGFLERDGDRLLVHDWQDYMGALLQQRQRNREKQQRWRETHNPGGSNTGPAPRNRHVTVTSPSRNRATDTTDTTQQTERDTRAHAREAGDTPAPPVSLSLVATHEATPDPDAAREAERALFDAWIIASGTRPGTNRERHVWLNALNDMVTSRGLSPPGVPQLVAQYRALRGAEKCPTPGQVAGLYSQLTGDSHASVPGRTSGTAQPAARTPEQEAQAAEDARRFQAEVVGLVHRNGAAPG